MYPIQEVPLQDIRLDLENYRIPAPQATEEDTLRYLLHEENVVEVVESFFEKRLF